MNPLEQERNFFNANQTDWEKTYPGKFVLVKGESLVGTFDDAESAEGRECGVLELNRFWCDV